MELKQKHKDYLKENNLNSVSDIAFHIERLKESGENRQMMLDLVWILVNEKSCLLDFFSAEKQDRINATRLKAEQPFEFSYTIKNQDNIPFYLDEVIYPFSWRPSQKTESTLNTKPVHSNPFNDGNYCPKKQRVEDAEKLRNEMVKNSGLEYVLLNMEEEDRKIYEKSVLEQLENIPEPTKADWIDFIGSSMKRGKIISYDSPLAPKQKDKVTTEDLKPSEVFPNLSKSHLEKGEIKNIGVKDNQKEQKAPIFTFCNQMKNAVEALAFRSLYGHERYKKYDEDWQNFSRVPNGEFEYSNAEFRHALEIGEDEDEEQHLVASAWNSIARLEIFLRNKVKS